jgi:uncharacterized protein YecE (DUF72 family)
LGALGAIGMGFSLGLAIWGYRNWLGGLFPVGLPTRAFLSCYADRFSVVEGNTTFYATPSPETVDRWAKETSPGFQFCPKLPKSVSHNGLLMPYLEEGIAFCHLMEGLGDRLGPFLLQLPPNYGVNRLEDLQQFLTGWVDRTNRPLALEVRHLDWFSTAHRGDLQTLLRGQNIARAILDTRPIYNAMDNPQQYSQNKKPQVPVQPQITSDFTLVRYISHPIWENNLPYLEQWAAWIDRQLQQGTRIYFFMHCPLEDNSPQNALNFQSLLEAKGIAVPPLPWNQIVNQIVAEPEQLGLF